MHPPAGLRGRGKPVLLARLAPWVRAPVLLRRQPGVLLALFVAAFILAVASASAPLFLATTGAAALERTIDAGCAEAATIAVEDPATSYLGSGLDYGDNRASLSREGSQVVTALEAAGLTVAEQVLLAEVPADAPPVFTLFSRPDALAHVDLLSGTTGGRGAWLPARFAVAEGLGVGDTVTLEGTAVPVAGVYADLGGTGFDDVLPTYWCTWRDLLVPGLEARPPPFLILDRSTLLEVPVAVASAWYAPLAPPQRTLAGVRDVLDRADVAQAALIDLGLSGEDDGLPRFGNFGYSVRTSLDGYLQRSEALAAGVRGPVAPVAVMATLIAAGFVAAAGGFWVERAAPSFGCSPPVGSGQRGWRPRHYWRWPRRS